VLTERGAVLSRASQLSQWFALRSVLPLMAQLDVVRPGNFPTLQRLLWGGEVLPTPALRYWMGRLPHVAITHLYGATETTIASSYYSVERCPDDDRVPIPIGRPCDGEDLLVLDETLRAVPPGEIGDLYIRGVGLSPGYWREPDKTDAAFLRNPFAGAPDDRIYRTRDLAEVGPDRLRFLLG